MADEATILDRIDTSLPDREVVVLECSNGETYRSTKFKEIIDVGIGDNGSSITDEVYSWSASGQLVTINIVGTNTTDRKVTIEVFGDQ